MTDVVVAPDHQLRRQVAELQTLAVRLDNNLGRVGADVAAVGQAQQQTRGELAQLHADFTEFRQLAVRTANIQLAETRVGVLQDEITDKFGRYNKVRHTAAGLLKVFDSGLVTQDSVEKATELLMIENPDYWLAPATVGLGAWSGGDSVLCDRAIADAYRLAPAPTALLFALILRRQSRQNSSVRWLQHYLANLDPMALSREFAVILESIAQGAFGNGGRELIRETVQQWLKILADDEEAQNAQVKRWRFEVERYQPLGAGDAFPQLRTHSPQWPALESVLRAAEAHQPFLDRYGVLLAAEYTPSERIEDMIDDILDRLVEEYHEAELPRRRELALQKAILAHDGDMAAAKAAAEAGSAALGNTLDYLTIQSSAALDPEAIGVSPATQQVALATCADWVERAHGSFCADYRGRYPGSVDALFQEQHRFGQAVVDVPPWTGSLTNTPMPELEKSLGAHWDKATGPFLAGLAFNFGRALTAPAVIAGIVLLIGVAINPIFGILVAAAIFGCSYLGVSSTRKTKEAYRKKVADALEEHKLKALEDLRATGAEYTDFQSRYRSADAKETQVRSMIESFADLGHDKAPHDRRNVLTEGATS